MLNSKQRVLIMGAAGRDFHVFNTCFRDNPQYDIICFTATQIPYIDDRKYPAELAGELYPQGIPIHPEEELTELIKKHKIDTVVFAYSDTNYPYVMSKGAEVEAAGANFMFMGPEATMIKSTKPVISVCAVRTGCGKSQTTRKILDFIKHSGKKVVAIRHPMPYGDLVKQKVQRFATYEDMDQAKCTIEEREEYEPYVSRGLVIYAGVDYEAIVREAEKEADIILWDGGNNDFSFYLPDLEITVVDPLRAGDEVAYYPGEICFRRASVIVFNKMDSAKIEEVKRIEDNIKKFNPHAKIIYADSELIVDKPELIKGKVALCVEDGPTTTHGGVKTGAASVAALRGGASKLVSAKDVAIGEIKATYDKYPNVGNLLPAMGYSDQQIKDLQETINRVPCEVVISGTPIALTKLIKINKPLVTVGYNLKEREGSLTVEEVVNAFLKKIHT
ncbi:MAG: cyclic 2,3-diphosphoglycerate synthase [Candidatus Woesearchaeota archaeon]|jgi:predicted GTPase